LSFGLAYIFSAKIGDWKSNDVHDGL